MKKGKIFKAIIITCMMLMIVAGAKCISERTCYATNIYDGNYHDIAFDYEYDSAICECTDVYTTVEEKRNDTSAYIYNNNSAARIPAIRVKSGNYVDCTYKNIVQSCELGEAKYLLNTVYESGFNSAMLWMDPGNGFHVRLHFLWSPDSIPL